MKKEISQLQSKKASLQIELAKQEQTVQVLQNQMMELKSHLSRTESALTRSQQEIQHYKNAEARLVSEVTTLQRQTAGSSALTESLKKFQLQLEETNNEEKKRLQVTLV